MLCFKHVKGLLVRISSLGAAFAALVLVVALRKPRGCFCNSLRFGTVPPKPLQAAGWMLLHISLACVCLHRATFTGWTEGADGLFGLLLLVCLLLGRIGKCYSQYSAVNGRRFVWQKACLVPPLWPL